MTNHTKKNKIIIAITGASGALYAQRLLDKCMLLSNQYEDLAIVMSETAKKVWGYELNNDQYHHYPFKTYDIGDYNAPFASGSNQYHTMIIIPCAMGHLARITQGISSDLIARAADVILKERRKLICVIREMPLSLIHLKNMEHLTLAGGIICPASPHFYGKPQDIISLIDTVIDRVIDLAGLNNEHSYRWSSD